MAERLNAPVLKTGVLSRGPWVRIPPPPPIAFLTALHYLYRAVDKQGKSVGSLLRADRGMDAAKEFFRETVTKNHFQ